MKIVFSEEIPNEKDLWSLYNKIGWNQELGLSEKQLTTAMDNSYYIVSAYVQDELIGTGRIISDGVMTAYLCGLGVLEEYRKQGIGTEILKKLKNKAISDGLRVEFFCEESLKTYYEQRGSKYFAIGMKG